MYIAVRGWLEIDEEQCDQVRDVIDGYRDHACHRGWIFPGPTGWGYCVFYGADLREGGEVELRELVSEIARLPSPDDVDDDRAAGQFVLCDERGHSWMWVVHEGRIQDAPPPRALHHMLVRP
jgi:hypothetical protein